MIDPAELAFDIDGVIAGRTPCDDAATDTLARFGGAGNGLGIDQGRAAADGPEDAEDIVLIDIGEGCEGNGLH